MNDSLLAVAMKAGKAFHPAARLQFLSSPYRPCLVCLFSGLPERAATSTCCSRHIKAT